MTVYKQVTVRKGCKGPPVNNALQFAKKWDFNLKKWSFQIKKVKTSWIFQIIIINTLHNIIKIMTLFTIISCATVFQAISLLRLYFAPSSIDLLPSSNVYHALPLVKLSPTLYILYELQSVELPLSLYLYSCTTIGQIIALFLCIFINHRWSSYRPFCMFCMNRCW